MSEFRGEMKTLVQTYVELLYPDDLEMQDALFENITSGKASVTVDEMRDYVATRSSWYAEIEAVNPSMAVVHNQNDDFVGSIEVLDDSDDPDSVQVFVNDDQMNEISSTNLYEDGQFWEDYDAETFNAMTSQEKANRRFNRAWIKAMQKFADNPDNEPLVLGWIAQDLLFNLEVGQGRYGYTDLLPIHVYQTDDEGNRVENSRLGSSIHPQTAFRELELSGKIATGNLERFKRFQEPETNYNPRMCFWVYSYKDENGQQKTYASPRNEGRARQNFTKAVYRGEVKLPSSVKDEIPAILELRRKASRKELANIRKTQKIQLELHKEALEKGQEGAEDIAQMMLGVKKIDSFRHFHNAETSHFGGHSTEPICTTYACRTEIGGTHKGSDAMRFLAFLNEIKNTVGISNISYEHIGDEGSFGVVVFKFDICKSGYKPTIAQVKTQLDGLRNGMILRGADYGDLHRPIETLAEGDEPNEEWYMEAETFNAMSFKQWSNDEMNEELHGGQNMDFDSWLNDEIHTHGNIPLREWGYEEEHDEPEHQHAEFGLFTPHPSPPEPKDKLTGEDGYYTLPQIKRMIARDMIYHSSDGDVDFNDIFDDAEIEILTSWADEAGEDVREYIEDRFLTYSELVTAVTNASSLKGMQRIFEAYKFPYRVTADRKLSDGSYEYKLELIPKFKKAQTESMMSEDYDTDEEFLHNCRTDINRQIELGQMYAINEEKRPEHCDADGNWNDGENFYTILNLWGQYHYDEDKAEKLLYQMFREEYPQYLEAETFEAKGIDTYAEPFEEIGNFYSGKKGILKIVGLGALVSAGVWITKNKLLE